MLIQPASRQVTDIAVAVAEAVAAYEELLTSAPKLAAHRDAASSG